MNTRRKFIKCSGTIMLVLQTGQSSYLFASLKHPTVKVDAHLWVYASRYPPNWDCTPILDEVFSDLKYAGYDGIELMESVLKHDDAVARLNELMHKYKLPVTGTSYYGDMWDKNQQQHILEDIQVVIERLHLVRGKMIGLTVGDAKRIKTDEELDTQAGTLQQIITICEKNEVIPNLHNHTFEVTNGMHDLKGTLKRIPGIKLGP